jgi:uncharacterized protein DUF6134
MAANSGTARLRALGIRSIAALWACLSSAGAAADALPRNLDFDVMRNGDIIGHHRVSFRADRDELVVDIDVAIKVDVLFVTVFRYEQQREEVWRAGRLVAFTSKTNDDGSLHDIAGEAGPDGLKITAGKQSWTAPLDSLPTSYWNSEIVKRGPLLDTIGGKLLKTTLKAAGEETVQAGRGQVTATHYVLEGDLPRELWYDAEGRWVKMRTKGSDGSTVEWILK